MGFVGLSPSNFISPIDFVPFLGPFNRLLKAGKYLNRARKSRYASGLIGKGRYYTNLGMGTLQGSLGVGGVALDVAAIKKVHHYGSRLGSDLYDFVEEHEDEIQRFHSRRGKLMM